MYLLILILLLDSIYLKKYEKGKEYLHVFICSILFTLLYYVPLIEGFVKPIRYIFEITFPPFLFFQWYLPCNSINSQSQPIVVLGCGLLDGNRISPLLIQRLKIAISFYEQEPRKIIVSGGKGNDEKISEARAMKNYLISQNILEEDILCEEYSTNTKENLLFTSKLIGNKFHVVTSDYHRLRVFIYSKIMKLNLCITTSHSIFYFRIYALVREYVAILLISPILLLIFYLILFFLV